MGTIETASVTHFTIPIDSSHRYIVAKQSNSQTQDASSGRHCLEKLRLEIAILFLIIIICSLFQLPTARDWSVETGKESHSPSAVAKFWPIGFCLGYVWCLQLSWHLALSCLGDGSALYVESVGRSRQYIL